MAENPGTGRPPNARRSNGQLARDRRRIAEMYLQGRLQSDIAHELGISQPTVSRDIARLSELWLESALLDINEAKARELAKIDNLEREYWDAWQRSIGVSRRETVKGRGNTDEAASVEKTITTEELNGDPRFLGGVQWCIEQRCRILGVYAAESKTIRGEINFENVLEIVEHDALTEQRAA